MKSYLGLSHSITQNPLDLFSPYARRKKSVCKKNTVQTAEQLCQKREQSNGNFRKRLRRLDAMKV